MSAQFWITKMLERHGVAYEDRRHEDAFTAQEVAEHEHFSGRRVVKVVVVVADDRMVELVLPANRQVSLERVREILNAQHVRLATEDEMELRLTGAEVGAVPPLRHWDDLPIIMDKSMTVRGDILMQAGTHTDAVRVRFGDWFQLVQPRVESFTLPAEPSAAHSHAQECWICAHPENLHEFLDDLLEVLHDQAKEIERLTAHVERHTDRLLESSQMPVLVSEISDLRARLRMETSAH
ncbi:MAG TPA: YbaK/EbsC family protein [Pirellulales bacterium]|nr:YbaK/EbsC family protein [Pirellulales bacterium]